MSAKTGHWNPFRMRNLLGGALVLGILAGVWLGDFFKGPGLGPESGKSPGDQPATLIPGDDEQTGDIVSHSREHLNSEPDAAKPGTPRRVQDSPVRILIDDREYFLLQEDERELMTLEAVVLLIQRTEPDHKDLRAIVERTSSSRVTAEVKLFDALKAAGIPLNSVYLAPLAVDR